MQQKLVRMRCNTACHRHNRLRCIPSIAGAPDLPSNTSHKAKEQSPGDMLCNTGGPALPPWCTTDTTVRNVALGLQSMRAVTCSGGNTLGAPLLKLSCNFRKYGRGGKVCRSQPPNREKHHRNDNVAFEPPVYSRTRQGKNPENSFCNTLCTQIAQASVAYGGYGTSLERVVSSEPRGSS
jgi:hypothetical protein